MRPLGYFLIGLLLAGMAGRSSLFAGDGGPDILQHDLREDPARDLIQGVRKAVNRFRGVAVTETGDAHLQARRICDEDDGQTP